MFDVVALGVAIVLFIASKFFVVGMLLAAWALVSMIIVPAAKSVNFLFSSPRLIRKRGRALTVTALALAGITAIVFLVPVPLGTQAEGRTPVYRHIHPGS